MKFCTNCGATIEDDAYSCPNCGCAQANNGYGGNYGGYDNNSGISRAPQPYYPKRNSSLDTVIKVFLIIGCVAQGWAIIPLAWLLPITIMVFKAMNEDRPVGTGLKVCALLFVNLVAGICLLCRDD